MPCCQTTRAKVTRRLGLVRAIIPVSDKNARWINGASLFQLGGENGGKGEKKV